MGLAEPVARLTPDAYLVWESEQPNKNEYFFGEVYAMVGTTDAHNVVAGNIFSLLRHHLRSGPCRVFISEVKVRPQSAEVYFYPDVFVTCDERDQQNRIQKSHPVLIVEVLSESTGYFDRGEKFAAYRSIEELREYLLIDPERRTIDLFRLGPDKHWVLWDIRGESELVLESVGLTIRTAELFENVPTQ
ncbi:MAG: Uma2 family endonuclease [Burkholderiales bacterium]